MRKKTEPKAKNFTEINIRFLNKNRTLNNGLAPLRVLRIFGKFRAKPKFVYICDVPRTNAATAGQAGGTLHASVFELNKYAETTTPFIIYLSLSNFTTENLTFTQKSISELKRQKKFVEKLDGKSL